MPQNIETYPAGTKIEEVLFNLTALATRNGRDCDTLDWVGGQQGDFADLRTTGWPLLDVAVRSVGALQINIQYAVPTDPEVQPPTLTYTTVSTVAVVAASWGEVKGFRVTARYVRVSITDTSNAANNGNYLVAWLRSQ